MDMYFFLKNHGIVAKTEYFAPRTYLENLIEVWYQQTLPKIHILRDRFGQNKMGVRQPVEQCSSSCRQRSVIVSDDPHRSW